MSQNKETYVGLKLNGRIYSPQELCILSDSKCKNIEIPKWEKSIFHFINEWLDGTDYLHIKTSGSTGKPKKIQIEKVRMIASAKATNTFFGLDKSKKALLCLSSDFIAGKMMLVRAFVGGFDIHYTEPKSDALLKINGDFDFAAVVPVQLESVLKSEHIQSLSQIKKMIIGGATVRQDLIQSLEQVETEVWATYGMTETITHIALQGLNGKHKTNYFQGLPNVDFQLDERSCLRINAPAVSLNTIQTNDRVELLNTQQFRFLGRVDFVINSGGIKLSPEILEQKLELHLQVDFTFSSKKDDILGERLVLVVEAEKTESLQKEIHSIAKKVLDRFEQPKEIVFIENFPKTANNKLDRIQLKKMIT